MTGMVSYKELDVPEAMAYVLEVVGQDKVAGVIAIGAVIGIMAVIFAYIYATTRVFFAMSVMVYYQNLLRKLTRRLKRQHFQFG